MSEQPKSIEELVKELGPDSRDQVRRLVETLLQRQRKVVKRKLRQDWAGALRDYRAQYTSLELQKKASEWRGD
jgi:Protein of unknown function (DUF2281)